MFSIGKEIKDLKRGWRYSGLTAEEANKRLLQEKSVVVEINDDSRIISLTDPFEYGTVAVLVLKQGRVYKAVLERCLKVLSLKPSNWTVKDVSGDTWHIYKELGIIPSSVHGYNFIKMPYTEASWQPYRHHLVAKAFGLLDDVDPCDDWVINHMGGKELGDHLLNLEVVTKGENSTHGKFCYELRREFKNIKKLMVSAKQAELLKRFYDPICGALESGNDTDVEYFGYKYKVKIADVKNKETSKIIKLVLTCEGYSTDMILEVEKNESDII